MNTNNRVWMELELPSVDTPELGHQRAAAATKLLAKLGIGYEGYPAVWFDETKRRYAFTQSSAGTFLWAEDHGHWFNLDKLSA